MHYKQWASYRIQHIFHRIVINSHDSDNEKRRSREHISVSVARRMRSDTPQVTTWRRSFVVVVSSVV